MDVIETVEDLHRSGDGARCVLAAALEDDLAEQALEALRLHRPPGLRSPRRPRAVVEGAQLDLVLQVIGEQREQHLVEVLAGEHGLLVVAEPAVLDLVRTALGAYDDAEDAVVGRAVMAVVLAVARRCEDVLDDIDEDCQELEARATGYASASQRRSMSRLRALLFHLQETQAAQHALLSAQEELAQRVGPAQQTLLTRAATAFDANRSTAARLYAMLGDLLREQDTVVSERLTLVATIFMPLTLATGFFGMNFSWMTDRIGALPAFLGLGIALPAVLTAITLLCIHRLTRSS